MSKYVKTQDSSNPWMIDESNQTWTLAKKATITVTGEAAINIAAGVTDSLLKLRGDIDAKGAGSQGLQILGDNTTVQVKTSSVIEARDGIFNFSTGSLIQNAGSIEGKHRGITSDSSLDITNSGRVSGDSAIVVSGDSAMTNLKGGLIEGDAVGIRINTLGSAHIENYGKIIAEGMAIHVDSLGESDFLNRGKIVGNVQFGDGNDDIDVSRGKITGDVSGGQGHDTYHVGKNAVHLVEDFNSGADKVISSVSHKLADNIESLTLSGTNSIDGKGNELNNGMHGNEADNVLRGKAGHDFLFGARGDDRLIGGADHDTFVFFSGLRPGHDRRFPPGPGRGGDYRFRDEQLR